MFKGFYHSPAGLLQIESDKTCIITIAFIRGDNAKDIPETGKYTSEIIKNCIQELKEYFEGNRKEFTVPIHPDGTEFQKKVWGELIRIKYGTTKSYLQLAKLLGDEKSIRAIGSANGKNPIAILIPCHRVMDNDGSLVGYSGGLEAKKFLLLHEQEHSDSTVRNTLF